MLLVQFKDSAGTVKVATVADAGKRLNVIRDAGGLYGLAMDAIGQGGSLAELVESYGYAGAEDYDQIADSGKLLLPLNHPDPAHMLISGTGLTHLGSAAGRDAMHRDIQDNREQVTDSMRIFQLGLEGGKPKSGEAGFQPEWFYKGNGHMAVACGQDLMMPSFALDGGEEPELAGLYVIGPDHQPYRVGFCLGNEFSDHVMEKQNYLNLAHSKLRMCAFGPEVWVGDLPRDLRGWVKVWRDGKALWAGEFLTGETNMSHSISNLEHHHFKYAQFRKPGDVHVHFFGTSSLSYSAGVQTQNGDVFEIWAPPFVRPLRNTLRISHPEGIVRPHPL